LTFMIQKSNTTYVVYVTFTNAEMLAKTILHSLRHQIIALDQTLFIAVIAFKQLPLMSL